MRKFTLFLTIILIGGLTVFAQTPKVRKKEKAQRKYSKKVIPHAKNKAAAATLEREKFDPARNPADDLQAAIVKARRENKRIVLDIGGEWCGWCKKMDFYFLQNPDLAKLRDENFVWLKINFSEENKNEAFLSAYPEATGYPHLFVLEKDGTFLFSQGTSELEQQQMPIVISGSSRTKFEDALKVEKQRTYDRQKFIEFLKKWSPPKISEK